MSTTAPPRAFTVNQQDFYVHFPMLERALELLPLDYPLRWDVAACAGFMAVYGASSPAKIGRAMRISRDKARELIRETQRVLEPLLPHPPRD